MRGVIIAAPPYCGATHQRALALHQRAKVSHALIIAPAAQLPGLQNHFGGGENYPLQLSYALQPDHFHPLRVAEQFAAGGALFVSMGDENLDDGGDENTDRAALAALLRCACEPKKGAQVFARFAPESNAQHPLGIGFYDHTACAHARELSPSPTPLADLNARYAAQNRLTLIPLSAGIR